MDSRASIINFAVLELCFHNTIRRNSRENLRSEMQQCYILEQLMQHLHGNVLGKQKKL